AGREIPTAQAGQVVFDIYHTGKMTTPRCGESRLVQRDAPERHRAERAQIPPKAHRITNGYAVEQRRVFARSPTLDVKIGEGLLRADSRYPGQAAGDVGRRRIGGGLQAP